MVCDVKYPHGCYCCSCATAGAKKIPLDVRLLYQVSHCSTVFAAWWTKRPLPADRCTVLCTKLFLGWSPGWFSGLSLPVVSADPPNKFLARQQTCSSNDPSSITQEVEGGRRGFDTGYAKRAQRFHTIARHGNLFRPVRHWYCGFSSTMPSSTIRGGVVVACKMRSWINNNYSAMKWRLYSGKFLLVNHYFTSHKRTKQFPRRSCSTCGLPQYRRYGIAKCNKSRYSPSFTHETCRSRSSQS